MSDPLAEPADLAKYLRQDVDTNPATMLLASASQDIRGTIDRFAAGETTVDLLVEQHVEQLHLPSRFVTEVSAIVDEDGRSLTDWKFYAAAIWWGEKSLRHWHCDLRRRRFATVTYTSTVPADVLADVKVACCQLAALAYLNPGGHKSEKIDDYAATFADNAGASAARDSILARLKGKYGTRLMSAAMR